MLYIMGCPRALETKEKVTAWADGISAVLIIGV